MSLRVPVIVCGLVYIFVYVPQIIGTPDLNYHPRSGLHVPCSFFDTVNVTGDVRFPNGSYLHDDLIIPPHLIGLYDYVYKDLLHWVEVEPHWRGCICKLKPCINFCCPWGTAFHTNLSICVNTSESILWPEPHLNVTLGDGTLKSIDIFEKFTVKHFRPCAIMFALLPEVNGYDEWRLFENGTMLRVDDSVYISRNEYCFVPTINNDTDTVYAINPANCDMGTEFATMKVINAYAMLFSIPFMILTITVYLVIPELRNQHGISLVCYLVGLSVGYSMLSYIALAKDMSPYDDACKVVGYTAYYFFMAAFFWLSVISFDLWHNFRGTRSVNRIQNRRRFILYSLYAWGLAAIFLVFTWVSQEYLPFEDYLKPGIGGGEFCWLEMRTWSAMLYFYGPILIIIVANTIMFIMTSMKIHTVQREMARIMAREDSTRNLRSEKDKFGLFLRLFIVMGVTWSLEILSYFAGSERAWAKIFYISDICNAIQGFLIFMLFVMKKKVKQMISNRFCRKKLSSHTNSTNSTNSDISHNPDKNGIKMHPQANNNKERY